MLEPRIANPSPEAWIPSPHPPAWVFELVQGDWSRLAPDLGLVATGELTLAAANLPRATALSAAELREATRDLYSTLLRTVHQAGTPHPVRCWNFLPSIHQALGDGLSRYMVFNCGRWQAFQSWDPVDAACAARIPTATGVGHDGEHLSVWVLAMSRPGRQAENPRQRPAYRYSTRWGPRPPCFARSTGVELDGQRLLLVGGTAAVRGEDSVSPDSLAGQLQETFCNLDSLVTSVVGASGDADRDPSRLFCDLRVYLISGQPVDDVELAVRRRFSGLERLEIVTAEICRPELLVEIEGVARCPVGS